MREGLRSESDSIEEPPTRKLVKVRQLMADIDELNSKLNVVSAAFLEPELNDVKYLDEQRTVCLVSGAYLHQLTTQVNASKQALESHSDNLKRMALESERASRQCQSAMQRAQNLEDLLMQAVETNGLLERELKRSNTELVEQGAKIAQLFANEKTRTIIVEPAVQNIPVREVASCSTQTDYWEPKVELITHVHEVSKPTEKEPSSEMQQRLSEVLTAYEQQFEGMSKSLDQRLRAISEQHLEVADWKRRNEQLTNQNIELKEKMTAIELEKAKVLLWRDKVESRVKIFEEGLLTPLPAPAVSSITVELPTDRSNIELENTYLKSEMRRLRNLLLEKKLQASMSESGVRLAELFQGEPTEPAQGSLPEGSIGRMVTLSEKLKAVAKWITEAE